MPDTESNDTDVAVATEAAPPETATEAPVEPAPAQQSLAQIRQAARERAVKAWKPGNEIVGTEEPQAEPAASEDKAVSEEVSEAARMLAKQRARKQGQPSTEEPATSPQDTEPTADTVPEGFVRIPLPEDHPLRDRGKEYFDAPESDAEYFRYQINNPIRNRQVEEMKRRTLELERELAAMRARQEALQSDDVKALDDPKNREVYEDIKQAYGEETADVWLQGIEARKQQIVDSRATSAIRAMEIESTAQRFVAAAVSESRNRYPVWGAAETSQRLSNALDLYADYVDRNGVQPSTAEFFTRFVDPQYASDPRVIEQVRQEQARRSQEEKEALKQEIREELLREAAASRANRASNPLGRVPRVVTGARTPVVGDESEDISSLTPNKMRRALRKRAAARVQTPQG